MTRLILAFSAMLLTFGVWAEGLMFQDASELIGTWILEGSAITRDGERKEENNTWDFQPDGKLVATIHYPFIHSITGSGTTQEDTYQIKDGKLVTALGGQYELVERQGDQMILKGSDGFFFFRKK
jgi:hypothetical protein